MRDYRKEKISGLANPRQSIGAAYDQYPLVGIREADGKNIKGLKNHEKKQGIDQCMSGCDYFNFIFSLQLIHRLHEHSAQIFPDVHNRTD